LIFCWALLHELKPVAASMVIPTIALDLLYLPLNLTQNIAQHFAILNIIGRHHCPTKIVLLLGRR
jgi:hypothetical protein